MPTPQPYKLPVDKFDLLSALLDTIENDIVPLTERGVALGNKVFGSALLQKSDYALVLAETNNEIENPLWHGEIHCLKKFYEMDSRPNTSELIFLSTHEPCSLCLSAITWAGFDNFFYYFSYQNSRDDFSIPHDLRILGEVFGLDGGEYRKENAYWNSWHIGDEIKRLKTDDQELLTKRMALIEHLYKKLSASYQQCKTQSKIPLK